MKTYPAAGTQIELTNLVTHETSQARVVGVLAIARAALLGVAVELFVPSETFWGMNLQLRKTCADLVSSSMRCAPALSIRVSSGNFGMPSIMSARPRGPSKSGKAPIAETRSTHGAPLLTAEGIRRATQLCDAINTGLAAHDVAREPWGLMNLPSHPARPPKPP